MHRIIAVPRAHSGFSFPLWILFSICIHFKRPFLGPGDSVADTNDDDEDENESYYGEGWEEENEASKDRVRQGEDLFHLRWDHVGWMQHVAQTPAYAGVLYLERRGEEKVFIFLTGFWHDTHIHHEDSFAVACVASYPQYTKYQNSRPVKS